MTGDFLKHKKTVMAIISIIVVVSAISGFVIAAAVAGADATKGSFTLTATGQAYDPNQQKTVHVTLTATGIININTKTSVLQVKSGEVHIDGIQPLLINTGTITAKPLAPSNPLDALLTIQVTSQRTAPWHLSGTVGSLSNNPVPITFNADSVMLPFPNKSTLNDLSLIGQMTISNNPAS